MKRLFPTGTEAVIFAAVALLCAAIAALARSHDLAMALFALPIFGLAAWMGMRRSGQWAAIAKPLEAVKQAVDEVAEEEEPAA